MIFVRFARVITAAVAVIGLAGPAHAGGFSSARFGGEHGHAAADHPTSLYFNPAGMALGSGTRVYLEGLFVLRFANYERPVDAISNVVDPGTANGTPNDATGVNAGEASLTNFLVSPFLGVVSDLGVDNLGVGFGVYAPFGGQASWERNDQFEGDPTFPGAVDGVQRWSTIEGALRSVYITAGGAYRIADMLSIGATINVVRSSIDTVRARVANGSDDVLTSTGAVLEGRSLVQTAGTDLSIGAGAIVEAMPETLWLGLAYQSQPGFGETSQGGTLTQKFGDGPVAEADIDLVQALPDVFRLGARYRPMPNVELRLSGDYTRWSVFDKQCLVDGNDPAANCSINADGSAAADAVGVIVNIQRSWEDTFGFRAGGSYWLDDKLELGGSLAYDSNAVPDDTIDPSLMDMDKVIATAQGRFDLSERLRLAVAYTHVFYFSRDVAAQMPLVGPSQVPDFQGSYSQTLGFISLGLEGQIQ